MAHTRLALLKQLSQHLTIWDGTSEHANELIEQNKPLLEQLKTVDTALQQQGNAAYNESEQRQAAEFITAQQELLTVIKQERKELLSKMKQVNQKNKIAKNYYSSVKQPIFVDKGM